VSSEAMRWSASAKPTAMATIGRVTSVAGNSDPASSARKYRSICNCPRYMTNKAREPAARARLTVSSTTSGSNAGAVSAVFASGGAAGTPMVTTGR